MPLRNYKVAIYIRVSTQHQIDKESLSVQQRETINYCKYALNIIDEDNYVVFEDAGYSAKNTSRPNYQQMMTRLRMGEFTHVAVWKIDRINRNLLDFAAMYEDLKKLNITFVSKNEQFDTSTAMGEAMLKIILVFAELERNMTSERVTAVMLSRAENKQWNGGRIPFGYDYDKTTQTFSINKTEAEIVKYMFNSYIANRSIIQITKLLNEKGLYTRQGKNWSPTTVCIVLNNPFYIGTYRYNYLQESKRYKKKPPQEWVVIENHHIPIVEHQQFTKVQSILNENKRNSPFKSKQKKNTHIFAGLLLCGYCGSGMTATVDRMRANGWRPSIYQCSHKRQYNDCPNKIVSDVKLGPFVLNYIANIIRAQRTFGKTTSIKTLEKKLLRGDIFSKVEHIEQSGLQKLYNMFQQELDANYQYEPDNIVELPQSQELDLLMNEKKKYSRALERLKTLYLYADTNLSEKEYLLEQKKLTDAIANVDSRLQEVTGHSPDYYTISNEEFINKASTFIIAQQLLNKRYISYEKLVLKIDAKIIKEFINKTCQNFCIKDGKIISICFKNGIEHKFLYQP